MVRLILSRPQTAQDNAWPGYLSSHLCTSTFPESAYQGQRHRNLESHYTAWARPPAPLSTLNIQTSGARTWTLRNRRPSPIFHSLCLLNNA